MCKYAVCLELHGNRERKLEGVEHRRRDALFSLPVFNSASQLRGHLFECEVCVSLIVTKALKCLFQRASHKTGGRKSN
jgi:hypothetical protein